jgi:hypothetical protein
LPSPRAGTEPSAAIAALTLSSTFHAYPSRSTTSHPSLGPAEARALAHCLAKNHPHRQTEPPRLSPPTAAARPRRRPLRPNYGHHPILGEHVVEPGPFPGRERRWPCRIPTSRAAPMAKGRIASPRIFLWCLVQTEGIVVKVGKDLGALVQNGNINSKRILLILVNSLENRRNFRKLQTQFF